MNQLPNGFDMSGLFREYGTGSTELKKHEKMLDTFCTFRRLLQIKEKNIKLQTITVKLHCLT